MPEGALYKATSSRREEIVRIITDTLAQDPAVVFAYLYGSFLDSEAFHDVDLGIRFKGDDQDRIQKMAFSLAGRLSDVLHLPVDVRPLNSAPTPFLYQVLRGRLLVSRDEEARAQIVERAVQRYLDIAPLLRHATREAFGP